MEADFEVWHLSPSEFDRNGEMITEKFQINVLTCGIFMNKCKAIKNQT